ncbi:MAG: hypothetical protein IJ256_05990 [Bacteroidaceae bacterium]|nr:hypothetical protein [Bacteroidaceae bacterium]
MMNGLKKILSALAVGVLTGISLGSCTDEIADTPKNGAALMLCPVVNESGSGTEIALTRFGAATATDENTVKKMDVYIFDNTSGNLVKAYHLNSASTMAGTNNVLENKWQDVYTQGTTYDIYVIANSPVTPPDFATRDALKAWQLTDEGVYSPATLLMDGNMTWTPAGLSDQYLTGFTLTRAVAKLELTVKIGATLAADMNTKGIQVQRPVYRPVNYNVNTVLASSNATATRNLNILDDWLYNSAQDASWAAPVADQSFTLTAYSYSFSWSEGERLLAMPKMLVSLGNKLNESVSYHYYLLPMVNSELGSRSLIRNYIYKVTATLTNYGSTEGVEEIIDTDGLQYEVIPWGSETQSLLTAPEVKYLKVLPENPTIYEGEVGQYNSITLTYTASSDIEIPSANISAYFIDKNGVETAFTDDRSSAPAGSPHFTVVHDAAAHTITVKSMVPTNKAVKYIRLKVKMVDDLGNPVMDAGVPYEENILVRHFPADYVMNIPGWWSSRYDPAHAGNVTQAREETTDLATAQAWGNYNVENRTTYGSNEKLTRSEFTAAVPGNGSRGAYNSNNPYETGGYQYWGNGSTLYDSNGNNVSWNDCDWRGIFAPYQFQTYWRRSVTYTTVYYRYVQAAGSPTGNWVNWSKKSGTYVEQVRKGTTAIDSVATGTADNRIYQAKFSKVDGENSYWITSASGGEANANTFKNNHMYVIQTKTVPAGTTLARPNIPSGSYFSNDDVISPAFMVSSNLGNLNLANYPKWDSSTTAKLENSFKTTDAKKHCAFYLETSRAGKMYYKWRLPTAKELDIIINYQTNYTDVMAVMLPGTGYFDLTGSLHTKPKVSSDEKGLRCVRDLTPDDIRYINGDMTAEEEEVYLNTY